MTQHMMQLVIYADVTGGSGLETGVFHFLGDTTVTETIRTGYLLNNSFDQWVAGASGLLEYLDVLELPRRKGLHLDIGGGQHVFDVQFKGWEGATHPDTGNPLYWGDQSEPIGPANATGENPVKQMNVFMNFIRNGRADSQTPAELSWGEYSPAGDIENGHGDNHLSVAIEQPSFTVSPGDTRTFDGRMTLVETTDLNEVVDGVVRRAR